MNYARYLSLPINLILVLYLSTVNLVSHTGSTLSVIFATAGIILLFGSTPKIDTTGAEKAVFGAFIFFPAIYLLSFVINNWPDLLNVKNLKHIEDEFRMLLIVPMYILFRKIKLSELAVSIGIAAGALISGVYAVTYITLNLGNRVGGSYDAIAFGDISLMLAAMSINTAGTLCKKHRFYKYIISAAFLLGLVACILSGTRGTWAAIPALFAIQFAYTGKYINMRKRFTLLAMGSLIIVGSYFMPATMVAQRMDSAVSEVSDYLKGEVRYGGATVRLLGFRAAIAIFSEHPIIGAGPGNYRTMVDKKVERGELHAMTAEHSQPSSTMLSTLSTCGILGFIALMGIFIAPLHLSITMIRNHPAYRSIGYSLMTLVVGFFFFGLSEIIFRRSFYSSFYIILIAGFMALVANHRESLISRDTAVATSDCCKLKDHHEALHDDVDGKSARAR